jgi:hypothetical protein
VANQSYFVTVRKLRTTIAFTPDLMRQFRSIYQREATLFKESWAVGQAKYGGDTKSLSLLEAGGY